MRFLIRLALALSLTIPPALLAQKASKTATPSLEAFGGIHVSIPREGFGKEYLLSTSVIPQSVAATSRGLIGRVVTFELFADGVDMYESTKGLIVTDDLPARQLIATFPIVAETDKSVIIDFNQGMNRLIFGGWYSMGSFFNPSVFERTAEMPQSRVFETSAQEDKLVIRQTAQARSRSDDQNREKRYEIRYFIKPYQESDSFESKEMPDHETRYARFWEMAPQLEPETGRATIKMGRFDESRPIVFHYSANTPKDYEDAIQDGILYWNKAFGKEIVQAKKAPNGITAPNAEYNVVQWVPWDNAGFAYADLLLDPRSGEALHGQAFMTSVFAISGRARARVIIRAMTEIVENAEESEGGDEEELAHSDPLFGIKTACEIDPIDFAKQLSAGLEALLANPALTDEAVLKISQDYVRESAAHEVGHVLGLRHNFAGSAEATLSPKELDQFIKDYIGGEDLEKYETESAGTSSMDYNVFPAAVFMGWKMENLDTALKHDEAAIRWGYFDDKTVVEEKLLFGIDDDTETFQDVNRFDYGKDPIIANYQMISSSIRYLPHDIIERFIQARAPRDPRDRRPLTKVNLRASEYANRLGSFYGNILSWLKSDTRSRKVENEFDFIGELNEDERIKAHWDYLNDQIERLGGIDRVGFEYLPIDLKIKSENEIEEVIPAPRISAKELTEKLRELLDSENYETFVGLDEETYSWTEEEKNLIVERGSMLFDDLEEAVLHKVLQLYEKAPRDIGLKATGNLSEDDVIAKLEGRIIDLAKEVITAQDKESRTSGKVDKAFVEVIDFKYEHETRLAAAKALNDKTGSFSAWSKEAKQKIHEELKKTVEESLNIGHFKKFKDSMLSRSLREWYLQQQAILKLLPSDKKGKAEKLDANGKPS